MDLTLTADTRVDGIRERSILLSPPDSSEVVPGVLWSPVDLEPEPAAPLLLMGHPGGLHKRAPGLVARAHRAVRDGFRVVTLDLPGHGDRPQNAQDEQWVAELHRARRAGKPLDPIIVPLNLSIAERAVPEWRGLIDALLALPEFEADVAIGYSGMTVATMVGVPLVLAEPRIRAAVLGGPPAHDGLLQAARRITIPVEILLPWHDEELDRDFALTWFDAFASAEKTLHAFQGTHFRVPGEQIDTRFFSRHLRR